ncbi:MAG: response regulator [Nostocaceae cyanobacterium]|nr:response regulator [Nostocaceae cyanobacterium]
MSNLEIRPTDKLINEFQSCTQIQYNGQLKIHSTNGQIWTFYYRLGRIVWATGGTHPYRRWRRYIAQYCPDINVDNIRFRSKDLSIPYWDYHLLEILHARQKMSREQIKTVVESTILELLFDIVQQSKFTSLSYERSPEEIIDSPISFTSADLSLQLMQDLWKSWSEAKLANFSPNLAPVLRRAKELEKQLSPSVYKNFVALMNGHHTLRDLAIKMKQDVLPLTRSLLPYILKGIIELIEVPDLPLRVAEVKNNLTSRVHNTQKMPKDLLIACVDDSPQVCQILEQIITSNGLRCIPIQDSVKALPILIKHKPDLIFLDLVMPVLSGYEICTQLRRISHFTNTPVIILTGSDSIVDKVRAKAATVVGATDFITKPIVPDKIMGTVRKHLEIPSVAKNLS